MFKDGNSTNDINQWVSNIVSIDDKQGERKLNVGKIVGPPTVRRLEQQYSVQVEAPSSSGDVNSIANLLRTQSLSDSRTKEESEEFIHYITVKIPEKVFIDSLDIYETACEGALLKIEAQEADDKWMCLWQCDQPHNLNQQRLFRPTITPTPFKCDTLKLTLSNSLHLIDAIEVKGCKKAVLKRGFSVEYDQTNEYGELSKQMYKLVGNDLFADVFFEVEGKRVAAHRNILSCRSDYFGAMLSSAAHFRESTRQSPIYIPCVTYEVFIQVLTFLYTGHIDICKLPCSYALDLIRAADLFNLTKLEELVLHHLNDNLDDKNIITIYREAHDKLPILTSVIELCHDTMPHIFQQIVASKEFCSLSQELMLKILNIVVPKLPNAEDLAADELNRQREKERRLQEEWGRVNYDTDSSDD